MPNGRGAAEVLSGLEVWERDVVYTPPSTLKANPQQVWMPQPACHLREPHVHKSRPDRAMLWHKGERAASIDGSRSAPEPLQHSPGRGGREAWSALPSTLEQQTRAQYGCPQQPAASSSTTLQAHTNHNCLTSGHKMVPTRKPRACTQLGFSCLTRSPSW